MNETCLKRLHETQVEILGVIASVCEKYGLTYYLIGGTLLGAVRHKGFIPWDDDLDIAMPRDDYEKFLTVAQSEFGERYFLQTVYTDKNYDQLFGKVRKNGTLFLESSDKDMVKHHGIFVDIFPLDSGRREEIRKNKALKDFLNFSKKLLRRRRWKGQRPFGIKYALKKILSFSLWLLPLEWLMKSRTRILRGTGDCYVNFGSQYSIEKQTISKEKYDPPARLEFEGKEYQVPKDYDYVLRRIFGDHYMDLPPEEKRVTHNPLRLSFDTDGPDEEMGD
ncbi:MAG: LicD family protein [Clostridia bacterium]|nr:LicD family protein [Clostridia bacterium]